MYDCDEKEEEDNVDLKALMGANWVDPPKRERKRVVNYAENEFYRAAMAKTSGPRAGGPRLPKMPALQDFQFFNTARLTELFEREQAHEIHKHVTAQKEAQARAQVRDGCGSCAGVRIVLVVMMLVPLFQHA